MNEFHSVGENLHSLSKAMIFDFESLFRFCCQKSNMFLSHSDAVLNWSIFKGDKSLEMLEIRAEIHVTVLINGKDFLKILHNIYSSSTKTNSKSISLTFRPIEIVMCRQNVPFSTVLIWHFRRKNFTT